MGRGRSFADDVRSRVSRRMKSVTCPDGKALPGNMETMQEKEASLPRLRAVVVDDESHVRAVLRDLLAGLNCEVVAEGHTGMDAVELFRQHTPDILLLDINMPVLSGEESLMLIMPEFPHAVIVMITSMTDVASVDTCLDLGAANYIRKDTPLPEIKNIIKETLDLYYGPARDRTPGDDVAADEGGTNGSEVRPEEDAG